MNFILRQLPPMLADLAGVGLALWLLPPLRDRFQVFGFGNTVIIGAVFLLFCLSIVAIKKMRDDERGPDGRAAIFFDRRVLGAIGVFFALTLMLGAAYVSGFLDSVVDINRSMLDEPAITIYLLLTPASWLGIALIYMLLLTTETEPAHSWGTARGAARWAPVALLAFSGVNLMAVTTTGIWQAVWSRFPVAGDGSGLMAGIFILNLLLYLPPRLIYALRGASAAGRLPGVASLLTVILFLAYLSVVAIG
ncbi:MAG TPA: hypothetical protein VK879_02350 [Candidatus Sulfomarinibacteraceae bacterium]|nr:hypothetical protein [Candidatus Sulfomarinibacteraceae bacterium]